MIPEKSCPALCRLRASRRYSHPTQYRSFANIDAKHLQFTMNAWGTPGRVFGDQAKKELAQFDADASSPHASPVPREPRPIQLEPCSVPANNSLWLDEDQCMFPSWPEAPQHHPEQSVGRRKSRLRMQPPQNGELLT